MKSPDSRRRFFPLSIVSWRWWRPTLRRMMIVLLLALAGLLGAQQGAEWWLVTRLAWQLQRADDLQAPYLVRELARRDYRAFGVLVGAANSPRAAVALSARREIDVRVDLWQREAFLHPATFELSRTAIPLAEALADRAPAMGPSARHWARRTLEALVELASRQSLDARLELLAHCDRAFASLPREAEAAVLADSGAGRVELMLASAPEPDSVSPVSPATRKLPEGLVEMPSVESLRSSPRITSEPVTTSARPSATRPVGPLPSDDIPSNDVAPNREPTASLNPLRATPVGQGAANVPPRFHEVRPEEIRPLPDIPVDSVPSWFEMLVRGNSAEQQLAATKLAEQGYGKVKRDDALLLLSPSTDDRKALVDRVITSPRLESPAWLTLLVRDRAPEVRASAISAIATTGDERLLSLALETALHDPAPAVADQVPLLRARLR